MSLANALRRSKLSEGEPTNTAGGSPPGTLLADMNTAGLNTGQLGPAMLMMAAGRNAQNMRQGDGALSNEALIQASRQGLNPRDMHGTEWSQPRKQWLLRGRDTPYVSPGNRFNYDVLPGAPGGGNKMLTGVPKVAGDPIPRTPYTPDPGLPTRTPGAPPPAAPPPTQVPGGYPPTSGPYTGGAPGGGGGPTTGDLANAPRPSFDPTQLLLALRQATNGGALSGPNPVQGNLSTWLAQALRTSGPATTTPTRTAT